MLQKFGSEQTRCLDFWCGRNVGFGAGGTQFILQREMV